VGIRYSESKKEFTTLACGPVNLISEDEYGYPQNGILVYPNVNSCTTITVMLDDHEVFGTHLTVGSPTSLVETILNKINASRGARNVAQLHVVGVLKASGSGWKSSAKYSGQNLYQTLNVTFGLPKTTPIFVHEQEYKEKGADFFHYRVVCGHGVLGWHWKSTRERYPKPGVSISEGFKPLLLKAV
jgi:hypothetical protein